MSFVMYYCSLCLLLEVYKFSRQINSLSGNRLRFDAGRQQTTEFLIITWHQTTEFLIITRHQTTVFLENNNLKPCLFIYLDRFELRFLLNFGHLGPI